MATAKSVHIGETHLGQHPPHMLHIDGAVTGTFPIRECLRRACEGFHVEFPDVSELEAHLRTVAESNERLRDQLAIAGSSEGAHHRYISEGFLAAGCGEDEDFRAFLRRRTAQIEGLRERLAKCSDQRASARERVDHLKSARLADAAVVEAAVALKRRWEHYEMGATDVALAKFKAAVAAHPSYSRAEPVTCDKCGQDLPEKEA